MWERLAFRRGSRIPLAGLVAVLLVSGPGLSLARETDRAKAPPITIQHFRPHDARGINVFESPKEAGIEYDGFKIQIGAGFTQQFQGLNHENRSDTAAANRLKVIGNGFNNAVANLYIDAQLARGIYVANTIYLSSRHHRETWVKDGYLLVDGSPYENETLDKLMEYLTLKIGHFEINYGDAHFRRTDNGNAMYNPLVGNLIMDAFTTEIGVEAYLRHKGLMGMLGVTTGEIRGNVLSPERRAAAYLLKAGFDRQVNTDLRTRLTASLYTTKKSLNNTLYGGDRAGSRYYYVLENTAATEDGRFTSGRFNPGMTDKVTAWVVNPFVKYRMIELFGNIEQAKGRSFSETTERTVNQYAGEALVRFADDQLYLAGRFATVTGRVAGIANEITIDRVQIGGGWFITDNIALKAEYVKQQHKDYPVNSIFREGQFDGMMIEGVVSF